MSSTGRWAEPEVSLGYLVRFAQMTPQGGAVCRRSRSPAYSPALAELQQQTGLKRYLGWRRRENNAAARALTRRQSASGDRQEHKDFLRKVYTILSLQIILTTATSALFMFCDTIKDFVHASPALVLVSAIGSLGLIFALAVYRHQHPVNLYLLLAFTLVEAVSVATAVTFYEYSVVLQAFGLTAAVFLGLTAYTFQSKRDFSKLGAGLFACLWILIITSFMSLFFHNETVELVFAGAGALLFCGFIIYDTHLLMHQLSPEEHILASINLYLDIVNLFLHILRILDAMKKN